MTSGQLADVEPPPQDPAEAGPPDARGLVAGARSLRAGISEARAAPATRLRAARAAYESARDDVVRQQLAALPLARLKDHPGQAPAGRH